MNATQPAPQLQYLTVDDGTLAYEVTGTHNPIPEHRPLIVLAHGMGDDRRAYRFLAPALVAAGHRVAALDLRGCGASSTGWSSYTRTTIAADLVALTQHLLAEAGPHAKAVLVGHSIAGGAATIAAATAPHLFTALVELAPFTRKQSIGLGDLRDGDFRRGMTHLLATTMLGSSRAWAKYLDLAYPANTATKATKANTSKANASAAVATGKPADYDTRLAQIQNMLAEPGRMAVLKKMGNNAPTDAGAQLGNVACPVLIIQGSADPDWSDPRAEGERILADLPVGPVAEASRLEVIEGAGHYPHVQHPAQVANLVLDFLAATTSPTASSPAGR